MTNDEQSSIEKLNKAFGGNVRVVSPAEKAINEAYADEFIETISKRLRKYKLEFRHMVFSYHLTLNAEVEDVFNDTLLNCYETIKRNGFAKKPIANYGYSAYFTRSFKQNLENFNAKTKRIEQKETVHTLTYDDFGNDEQHYLMFVAPTLLESITAEDPEPVEIEDDYTEMLKKAKLKVGFYALPQHFQDVLNLRYDGVKYRDIARILSIPVSTVKARLNTARNLLKNKSNENE